MKPLRFLLLTVISFLTSIVFVFGQALNGVYDRDFDFFAPKKTSYTWQQTGYYGQMKVYDNGQKTGTTNDTYIDVKATHWLGKGFGVGLGIEGDWSGTHPTNSDVLTRTWEISPSLSYGKMIGNRWGMFARGEVTFGKDKDIYKSSQYNTTATADLFGYNGTIGFPYRISKYSALTTSIGYDFLQDKDDYSKSKESMFGLGIEFEDYLGCSDMKCDPGSGWKLSKGKYDQGNGFIDYGNHVIVKMGDINTDFYTQPISSSKDKVNNVDLTFRGSYYIINHLATGWDLSYTNSGRKADDNSYKKTDNEFHFNPEVIYNLPADNGWRNLFVKGGGYFGITNSETKSGSNSFTTKESFSGYNFGLGYYAFFADETALKICAYHQSITYKDKETEDKTRYEGFRAEIGIVHHFQF